jgi:4-hydroxybenzoate polyprenyltransferase
VVPVAASPPRRLRGALLVIHPIPSAINALLVSGLALAAGASGPIAVTVGLAMLALQACVGALNDVIDASRDARAKPWKPIPAGDIGPAAATAIGITGAVVGLAISATFGWLVLLLGAAGLACGLSYDAGARQAGLGWLCYALAFPILLAWAWLAAAGTLPPGWALLLPLAALAGPQVHLANSLVDVEADVRVGAVSLATRLGRRRGLMTLTALGAVVLVLAWAVLLSLADASGSVLVVAAGATILVLLGLAGSGRLERGAREAGWLLQAVGLASMALAWVVAATA